MRSNLFTLFATGLATVAGFASAGGIEFGTTLANGTMLIWDSPSRNAAPRVQYPDAGLTTAATTGAGDIHRRAAFCWDHYVNQASCDRAVARFRVYLRLQESGTLILSTGNDNDWVRFPEGDVQVYACLEDAHSDWDVTYRELDIGLSSMDRTCRLYQAGYTRGEGLGSNGRIIGKANINVPICQG
ncbi:hypothetical protein MN608_11609 [Microdochium nivale]|nr:hypothetical protein MN608_11609 [Microdochium nivale]